MAACCYAVVAVVLILAPCSAKADVPSIVSFQGVLTDEQGTPLDGVYSATFSIYDVDSGGSSMWSETIDVDCEDGVFSVTLGSSTPINLDFSGSYWLGIQVGGDPEMLPRHPLASVPYAFWSAVSDSALAVEWSSIRGMPSGFADGVDDAGADSSHEHDDRYYTKTQLRTSGTINAGSNPVNWTKLLDVPIDFADGIDHTGADSVHDHDDLYFRKEELHDAGTINDGGNPVDWTKLKNVPAGFADGSDDAGGGAGDGHSLDASDGSPTDAIYVDAEGDVGIGTTTPSADFHVLGTLDVGVDGQGYDVTFWGDDPGGRLFWDEEQMAIRAGKDSDGTHWASDSVGTFSVAMGLDAKALDNGAIAIGQNCVARSIYAFAAGFYADVTGLYATGIGNYPEAYGYSSTALGNHPEAHGYSSVAMGNNCTAHGYSSVSIGNHCDAGGYSATAIGHNIDATGMNSFAVGYDSEANGDQSVAIGSYVSSDSANSITIGVGDQYSLFENRVRNSLMVAFEDTVPTLFVGGVDHLVGIGTAEPSTETKLHVRAKHDNFGVLVDAEGTSGSEIGLHTATTRYGSLTKNCYYDQFMWQRFDTGTGACLQQVTPTGDVGFMVAPSGTEVPISWTQAMTIKSSGNIGMGETSPARTLHVNDVIRLEPRSGAPSSPAAGDMYIDSTDGNRLKVYDGSTWHNCW
jgi:hypothetical protein